jgi:cysteine desulfurase
MIYLDHNATTPLLSEVVDAMVDALRNAWGNPSSTHAAGKAARAVIDEARADVAALINASPDEIIFTSGGTEANNLAIRGVVEAKAIAHVVSSSIEHPAVARVCDLLAKQGVHVTLARVGDDGKVKLDDIDRAIAEGARFVTIMHSNNETGVLQPIEEIAKRAHAKGALVHTDAAQSVGKVVVDVNALDVDLAPLLLGAGHERGLRPGTENTASIAGLGAACRIAMKSVVEESRRQVALRDRLLTRLRERIPGVILHGHPTERLPNTLLIEIPGTSGTALLARCPDVFASTGSACHEGSNERKTIRLTLGRSTTEADVDRAAELLCRAGARPPPGER